MIPSNLTAKLIEIAKTGTVPTSIPDVKIDMPDINTNSNVNKNVDIHYDSLIKIDGNVDSDVMDRLEDVANALIRNKSFKD